MEKIEFQEQFKTYCTALENLFNQQNPENESDLVTLRTRKLNLITNIMNQCQLKWNQVYHIFKTQSFVHPKIAKTLMNGDDEVEFILAQGHVRNEKLIRILKNYKNDVNQVLAVDGLVGNLSNGPNFDFKYYLHNLKFEEPKSLYDDDSEYKRHHAIIVRLLYNELSEMTQPAKHVYNILREIFKDFVGSELPSLVDFNEALPKEIEEKCKNIYLGNITQSEIEELFKNLRWRGEKRTLDDEPASLNKVQ